MANEIITNVLLSVTPALAHTVTAGQTVLALRLEFLNTDVSNRTVTVWHVPSGETRGDQHKIIDLAGASAIQPGDPLFFYTQLHAAPGDEIYWVADASSVLRAGGSVKEIVGDGHEQLNTGYVSTSLTTVWTVSSGKAMTLLSLGLCNTHASEQGVELQIVPAGQSAAAKHTLLSTTDKIQPGETRLFRWPGRFAAASATIRLKCDTSNAVVFFGGLLEESV